MGEPTRRSKTIVMRNGTRVRCSEVGSTSRRTVSARRGIQSVATSLSSFLAVEPILSGGCSVAILANFRGFTSIAVVLE